MLKKFHACNSMSLSQFGEFSLRAWDFISVSTKPLLILLFVSAIAFPSKLNGAKEKILKLIVIRLESGLLKPMHLQ